ncbi:MAG TPA: tRNA (N6-isopentenyl adenosine(37)-C2)-methylthiotransferase MiaB [Candidatus Gastranaerophilaceae bacterium]|nr:tRNA (N6-isopentenyl adenosine(37)-C2)-methylthiotransferase MiaB [Candidatus Gastranaerophilaceae bacterium]HPT41477.1 tRNA (N6-isopentenyl adenosine(37)-C2)-methylthiotransferase MiaB [Candidatus Gastranaerophilaceae bacterium]
MKKVYVETLGCQMNKSDTEKMLGMLSFMGYEEIKEPKKADLLIINTCSIRQLSEDKAFSRIGLWGKWKKTRKNLKIAFCGCVAQQGGEKIFKRMPYIDLIMGTHNINEFPDLIKRIEAGEKVCATDETPLPEKDIKLKRAKGVNAWITITEGCDNFCTYCIVPYTRGRERSRAPEVIIKEVKEALSQGFKEITLLGQNVDSYKGTEGYFLAHLLKDINKIEGTFRIRFVTSYPTDITDELIETVIKCDKICEYFHIPMQSGSSEILKKMNRRYDRKKYFEIVKKVRDKVKDVTITSDFIAGFPGESEEQFEQTLSAIKELELDYCNTAAYSPREQTVAAKWKNLFLTEEVKDQRLARLNNQVKESALASNKKFIGREMEVLIEKFENHKGKNIITGRTRNNKIVHIPFEKDLSGQFVNAKITGAKTWYLQGEFVNKN